MLADARLIKEYLIFRCTNNQKDMNRDGRTGPRDRSQGSKFGTSPKIGTMVPPFWDHGPTLLYFTLLLNQAQECGLE